MRTKAGDNFVCATYYVLPLGSYVYSVVMDLVDFHVVSPTFLIAIFQDLKQIYLQLQQSDF